ncbi:sugar transferase [Salibacterium halotolerans]|uniref:Sugar transferase involved in LPS biosynthesis (Colanic, teichoic acid) n=1 Tax=Salibacterium halotolerans TaxID=1884432 RepID=A0A1I5XVM3_9BACI|nr:sugar transferase [Salibacterium halotolerans]SFQ36009.1 Sugar transferase involved in LPS biosynthesis (colanic, teichoic acid) [Salibacterium halotolerans]
MRESINLKRKVDLFFSMILIYFLLPFGIIIALFLKLESRGPVFFKQKRVGIDGKLFKMYKFRSMTKGDHSAHYRIQDVQIKQHITKVGSVLRKTSLDELPQLINILKGDMSFIGPRPVLPAHLEQYNSYHMQRLYMKPGVTGLAQVKGRNTLPWSKRIEYDVQYVNNYSIWLDIKIILKTIKVVLMREGVATNQTMGEMEDFHIRKSGEDKK